MGSLLTGVESEMSLGFSVSGASQQEDSLSGGGQLGKLVESVAGSLGGLDSVPGGLGELEGNDLESFWDVEEPDVVGDASDNSDDACELVVLVLGVSVVREMLGNSREGEGESIQS